MTQNTAVIATPIPYDPSYEYAETDESKVIAELLKTFADIRHTTYKDTGHAMRSVHVKSHGLLKGELKVADLLPDYFSQGMFATPATYPLLMRLSTSPGDMLPDSVSTSRGCAIKVIGVKGDRVEGSEDDETQDFVMVNGGPTFQSDGLKKFATVLKLLAAGADKGLDTKAALSSVLQNVEKVVEGAGGNSGILRSLGGEIPNHILGETFYSQVPILFGKYIAKMAIVPVSAELTALTGTKLDVTHNPDALRNAVTTYFAQHSGVWELRAQLNIDIDKMPIEKASVEWPEELSPYITVATITIPAQTAWSEERSKMMDDRLSFSPWHSLAAHRPLGSIMRARHSAYKESARFRAKKEGREEMKEPKSIDGWFE